MSIRAQFVRFLVPAALATAVCWYGPIGHADEFDEGIESDEAVAAPAPAAELVAPVAEAPVALVATPLGGSCAPVVVAQQPCVRMERRWIPPVYETRMERVLVEPAKRIKRWIPATYGTRPRLECVSPAEIGETLAPGTYTGRRSSVVLQPARETWRKKRAATGACDCNECWAKETCPEVRGEICERVCLEADRLCLTFKPAQYRIVHERFELEPATCEEICVPPRYALRGRQVCTCEGRWEMVEVPVATPVASLAAIHMDVVDQHQSGKEAGIFARGETVRYAISLARDGGTAGLEALEVAVTLPPELEFVGGAGDNFEMSFIGGGREARSGTFALPAGEAKQMHVLARVVGVPAKHLVQVVATVKIAGGSILAREAESTTLREAAGTVATPAVAR